MKEECTIYKTTNFIGKRWTLIILLELYKGNNFTKRYSEIKKNLPLITPKVLSLRLKELNKEGLIQKKIDDSIIPIKCEYSLTDSGKDFIGIIENIKKWALRWKDYNKLCSFNKCKECNL